MYAVFGENYDGGDFCQGLLFTYNGLKVTEAFQNYQKRQKEVNVKVGKAHTRKGSKPVYWLKKDGSFYYTYPD